MDADSTAVLTVEMDARAWSVRVYSRHPHNPIAGCRIEQVGALGVVSGIWGRGFYLAAPAILAAAAAKGMTALRGSVTPAHARLLARVLPAGIVSDDGEEIVGGHKLRAVTVATSGGT